MPDGQRYNPVWAGVFSHQILTGLESEPYSTHFGTLRTTGMHVYLTGITPFAHTLTIG